MRANGGRSSDKKKVSWVNNTKTDGQTAEAISERRLRDDQLEVPDGTSKSAKRWSFTDNRRRSAGEEVRPILDHFQEQQAPVDSVFLYDAESSDEETGSSGLFKQPSGSSCLKCFAWCGSM